MDILEQLSARPLQQFFDTIFDLTKERGKHIQGNGIWDAYSLVHGSARITAAKAVFSEDRDISVLFREDGKEHSLTMFSSGNDARLSMSFV